MSESQPEAEVTNLLAQAPKGWVDRMPSEWMLRRSLAFQPASARYFKRKAKEAKEKS